LKSHDNLRSRRRAAVAHRQTPEQLTVARENALKWRDEWRAEVKACATKGNGTLQRTMRPIMKEDRQAARFATAIARAEFGRFYWSDKLADQLLEGLQKTPFNKRQGTKRE